MINCKKTIIVACLAGLLPLAAWSQAPVVDDSDNFAMVDEQQALAPVASPKYDESAAKVERIELGHANYPTDRAPQEDESALVKDDDTSAGKPVNEADNASLAGRLQRLQQELQELRGQQEVQAHDLKLLQQQQLSFYKDLDSRIAQSGSKSLNAGNPPTDLSLGAPVNPAPKAAVATAPVAKAATPKAALIPVSRANPADEQISYLAAYELIKNKQYDQAQTAMQTFVQKYPKGGYTANAEYWLGELYMLKKDYPKAIEHFEIVLHQFPSSSKGAASMLKAGYAYAAAGNAEDARRRLQSVMKFYPGTSTAQLASLKLEAIKAQ